MALQFASHHSLAAGCIAAIFVALMPQAASGQQWSFTTANFQTGRGELKGLSSDGAVISTPDSAAPRVIPLDQFVSAQLAAPAPIAPPKFTLLLAGGDRLVGEPVRIENEQLRWKSGSLGEVAISLRLLLAMGRGDNAAIPEETPKQDVVTLSNGDSVSGVVTDCSAAKITVQTDAGASEAPIASVVRVSFAAAASPPASHGFRITLADGSIITTSDATSRGDRLIISLLEGKPPRQVELPLSQIVGIEQLNGPVSWLSSRVPSESVQMPYFGGSLPWPAKMNSAVDGLPIEFSSQRFDHGIGVHSYSRLTFPLEAGWAAFRTQYAIESQPQSPRPLADVTVRISLDGKLVHEQRHVRAGMLLPVVNVDLQGVKTITLEADYGDGGDTQDHLNWIEPALLRSKIIPAAAVAPSTGPAAP